MTGCHATGCSKTCAGTPLAHATWCFAPMPTVSQQAQIPRTTRSRLWSHCDHLLAAYKVPRELRQESQHTGQAFLRAAMALEPAPLVQAFWTQVQRGATPGHHALVFGCVAQHLGCDRESTLLAYLYTVLTGLVAAALRLVPLGQSDGQRLLHELASLSRDLIAQYGELQPEEAWSATPGLDIRSMQHERLYSRLYRS